MTPPALIRLFDRLHPESVQSSESLRILLSQFIAAVQSQPSVEAIALRAEHQPEGQAMISGWVPYPAMLSALKLVLDRTLLPEVAMKVTVLPVGEPAFKSRDFFRCAAAPFPGHAMPSGDAEVVHLWKEGDSFRVLISETEWSLVQSDTGYVGWARRFQTEDSPRVAQPPAPSNIPLESWRSWVEPYLGAPYVWGGTDRAGLDCSGFVQSIYRETGVVLPRDSHQQLLCGTLVATHEHRVPLEPGDLLFFTHADGRVRHVGLSLGGWEVVHAEEPVTTTFSLDPASPQFNPHRSEHFVAAKRVLVGP